MSGTINKDSAPQRSGLTRRAMLFSLPALALASRMRAQERVAEPRVADLRLTGLHQVTLAVSDLERSLEFYQGLFGMPVQARKGDSILLGIGDGPHFLALTEAGSASPRIDHFGMAVEDFDVDRVVSTLAANGVTATDGGQGLSGGPERVRVTRRGDTPEIHMGDPNGLVIQLQHKKYRGGSGALGDDGPPAEPAPEEGSLALRGMSHLTIMVPDPQGTNAFYQQTFGLDIQAYQAASPLLGVGPGVDFLMFIRGGRSARIHHACLTLENFDVVRIQSALEEHGIRPRSTAVASGPLQHWVSMRMPNRGGAPEGTPELYFSDPDGLAIQIQDVTYCGGGGYLGDVCG